LQTPAPSEAPARPAQKSGVVVPQRLKWHGELAAVAIFALIKTLSLTWRARLVSQLPDVKGPVIFSIWHNRLALCMKAYYGFGAAQWPAPGLAALISASKDGALLARTLKYFHVSPVRGSSSRRGRQALLELTTHIENGFNVAITPDGPKGPKYKAQEGIIALSQITGATILPVSFKVSAKWALRSWDAFQIPKPFAACEIFVNKPIHVPREASDEQREALRAELERRMLEITFD
jgi:lysophospholipid acyltransferase (LPLAT)-like uncharacterized protein